MKRFCNILFVTDFSAPYEAALAQAFELASNNQARLTVVGVIDANEHEKFEHLNGTSPLLRAMVNRRTEELKTMVAQKPEGIDSVHCEVLLGKPFMEIIREVLLSDRDLVIKAVEPIEGLARLFLGTDLKLLRKCPCPVWLIKSTQQTAFREVIAALDYDPENSEVDALNAQVLEIAASVALSGFSELHVVHTWMLRHESFMRSPRSGMSTYDVDALLLQEISTRRDWIDNYVASYCASDKNVGEYLNPTVHLIQGNPGQRVPELARELGAELVVMGTVARTGIPGIVIGNTAETILGQLSCSVLTIKPEGFVSPVTL